MSSTPSDDLVPEDGSGDPHASRVDDNAVDPTGDIAQTDAGQSKNDSEEGGSDPIPAVVPNEVSPLAVRMDELGVVIDRIVEAERELAVIAACRAELIEQARRLSVADARALAEEGGRSVQDTGKSGWTSSVIAHRELIAELACALRIPERTISSMVEHSRALVEDLPHTLTALSAGQISYQHAQVLADHAASLPADAVPGFETAVLRDAIELTVTKFDRKARITREHLHPDTISTRIRAARENRSVGWEPARDGMAWLSAYLPADVAVASYNRIDDIATHLNAPDETRTLTQLRADVLTDLLIDGTTAPEPADPSDTDARGVVDTMAVEALSAEVMTAEELIGSEFDVLIAMQHAIAEYEGIDVTLDALARDLLGRPSAVNSTGVSTFDGTGSSATDRNDPAGSSPPGATNRSKASRNGIGHGIRAQVLITVPVLTLLGHTDHPATLEGYGPIDPDTARDLAAGAPSLTRILTHPETGAVLSVGRDRYPVPPDLRLYLRLRDETCRHPGCNRAARRCDTDHTTDWARGGATDYDNLAHLCTTHHNLKHHTAWTVNQAEPGTLTWTSPAGRNHITRPAATMPTPQFR